jgi:diaminohydroxyphosphoribosylaminopyrimidine deaminase/5-amino-6-(5-phosphoribosylamino)uracil reductase
MNKRFFHYITTGMPYVTLKYAMTADGKIASASGKSQWITGEAARKYVHVLRHEHAGIMAGIGTVLADDPMLNCRLENAGPMGASDPVRIIMDTGLRIPLDSKIVKSADDIRTIIVTADRSSCEDISGPNADGQSDAPDETVQKEAALQKAGCEILKVPVLDTGSGKASVDVYAALKKLGEMKISGILIEGGGTLAYSVLKTGEVNRVCAFIAPKFLGGAAAKTPVGGAGFDDPNSCFKMQLTGIQQFGDDLLIEYEKQDTKEQKRKHKCLQE